MSHLRAHSKALKLKYKQQHAAGKLVIKSTSEGRFVVNLLKKTTVCSERSERIQALSELSIKARSAPFLDKYRVAK